MNQTIDALTPAELEFCTSPPLVVQFTEHVALSFDSPEAAAEELIGSLMLFRKQHTESDDPEDREELREKANIVVNHLRNLHFLVN